VPSMNSSMFEPVQARDRDARVVMLGGGGSGDAIPRVIIADRQPWIRSDMAEDARVIIDDALRVLGIEIRPGVLIAAIDAGGATLTGGQRIDAATIVWCASLMADSLTSRFPVERNDFGRLPVD
jgi:NADH:ubiquinone reductase (H+-translocating)